MYHFFPKTVSAQNIDWAMAKSHGSRGPKRSNVSKIKMMCAYHKCRRQRDVKNVGAEGRLQRQEVNLDMCRNVRKHCKVLRFCCTEHLKMCKAQAPPAPKGGRAPLGQNQCIALITTLMTICPWAAILSLLQLFIMDRADCSRKCCWGWLSGMHPEAKCQPSIGIPKVNGKTIACTIPIYQPFAEFLWKTSHGHPIESPNGEAWPAAGQDVDSPGAPLFPGYASDGKTRDWNKPISERAFLARLHQAAEILRVQRAFAKANNVEHPFDGYDLSRLGTHSFKKTAVTLFSEQKISWAIISAISGTSIQMLQRSYDVATPARQHQAMEDVFDQAWRLVLDSEEPSSAQQNKKPAAAKYCGKCGFARRCEDDLFCTICGATI